MTDARSHIAHAPGLPEDQHRRWPNRTASRSPGHLPGRDGRLAEGGGRTAGGVSTTRLVHDIIDAHMARGANGKPSGK
jgi:hypothetical protein